MDQLRQDVQTNPVAQIRNLTFSYPTTFGHQAAPPSLRDVSLTLSQGHRYLVVGGNGAGKSSLLRILAGKHLTPDQTVSVFGRDGFRDTMLNNVRTYVSAEWGHRAVAFSSMSQAYSADIAVHEMMLELQKTYPDRRDELIRVLRIDPTWRMHKVSDGQRRRVQLFLALIRPCQLIILDEVLGLLDIIARQDFLSYLQRETQQRGVCVVLATNVFDGLSSWTSDLIYVRQGQIIVNQPIQQVEQLRQLQDSHHPEPLMHTVELWLRQEMNQGQESEAGDHHDDARAARAGGYAPGRLGDFQLSTETS